MNELIIAVQYSYESMTWITLLAIAMLGYQTVRSYNLAYENNKTYEDMKKNKDKKGLAQFYTAIITSCLSILVFFLPYLVNYNG